MLSARSATWAKIDFAHGKQGFYHSTSNPKGVVSFSNAENGRFDEKTCAYGEGYTGTLRLRTAMAQHMNAYFSPVQPFDAEQLTFAAGVTDLNEICALVTCNPDANESIMLGGPVYGAFSRDLVMRTGVELEYVSLGDIDQFSLACIPAFEAGFEAAKARGVSIKALIICNPHNPLGQCYPRETLVGLLRLCSAKGIHLISDEIYALSVYSREDRDSEKFVSVRAIDFTGIINPEQVHVLYGMSKDFGAAGMRLGCLASQNLEFIKAARSICRFSSPSHFSMEIAARLLEDQNFVAQFLEKSHRLLLQTRLLAEELVSREGIAYHEPGYETNGDGWAAERLLSERLKRGGVVMSTGEAYRAQKPGRFRMVHSFEEDVLKEGIRRLDSNFLLRYNTPTT
ncbi:PLP-dependent transferase [Thozetella sp. PMI_491]|nr:PLP-dependent transferase [Thozetella sp. PMI_491]